MKAMIIKFLKSLRSWSKEKLRLSVLFFLSVFFGVIGFYLKGSAADYFLNLSTNFVAVVMVFLILESGIERIRKLSFFDIREHKEFPIKEFIANVDASKNQVKMLDIWMYSLIIKDDNWFALQRSIKSAISNGVSVKILCAFPDSSSAKKRAEELKEYYPNIDIPREIRQCLHRLNFLKEEIESDSLYDRELSLFEIKLYNDLPSISMYLWDNYAYWGFYPSNKFSSQSAHLEICVNSSLGEYLSIKFDELWDDQETELLQTRHYSE
jgi:hypothetical protein